jgi:hypothetical protein
MKLLYITLLIALPSVLFAQSNYHEGYIVKNNGDTVKGFIDYREWGQSPISIDFKTNKKDKQAQQFSPSNCKGFGISGAEVYLSYSGFISQDKNRFPDLPGRLDTSKQQANIFLRELTFGVHLTLYSHSDDIKTRYFISELNTTPSELKYYQYYNDNHDAIERSFFRGQLIFYINKYNNDNVDLVNGANKTSFDEGSLEHIVNKINGGKSFNVSRKAKKPTIRFFIGAGGGYNKTRLWEPAFTVATNSGSYYYNIKYYSDGIGPQVNLGFDIFINPNVQRFIFRTEVSLSTLNVELNYPRTLTQNGTLKFDQYKASITPQLLYNIYNKDNFKFYIDGGVSANLLKYNNVSSTSQDIVKDHPDLIDAFNNFEVSLPIQTGFVINKKVELSFTYTPYAKFTSFTDFGVSNQSMTLGAKLFFR